MKNTDYSARIINVYSCFLYAIISFVVALSTAGVSLTSLAAPIPLLFALGLSLLWSAKMKDPLAYIEEDKKAKPARRSGGALAMYLLIAFLTFLFLYLALVSVRLPDFTGDGNAYHIPTIHLWALTGRVCWLPGLPDNPGIWMNGYPKTSEVLSLYITELTGNGSLVNLSNILFLPMGILGIAAIAVSLGVDSVLAFLVGLLYLLVPVNIMQSATTYVDSAFASATIATFAAFFRFLLTKDKSRWRLSSVAPLGMCMGLALGIKSSGILICFMILLALCLVGIFEAISKKDFHWLLKPFFSLLTIFLLIIPCGLYWYGRNYLHTGSPVYPVGLRLLNWTIFPGLTTSEAIGQNENTPEVLRSLPAALRVLYTWCQGGPDYRLKYLMRVDSRVAGLGFLWVLGCLPAILIVFSDARKYLATERERSLRILLLVILACFLFSPMNWWARYTLWIYAAGLPCLALLISHSLCHRSARSFVILSSSAMLLLVCLVEAGMCLLSISNAADMRSVVQGKSGFWDLRNRALHIASFSPEMKDTEFEKIDTQKSVGFSRLDTASKQGWKSGILGALSYPIGFRQLYHVPPLPTPEQMQALHSEGVKYILWDDTIPIPESISSSYEEGCDHGGFKLLKSKTP